MKHEHEEVTQMKRLIMPAGVALAAVAPSAALAKPPTASHVRAYEAAYKQVAHKLGRRAPGRNIIRDGVAQNRPATDAETVSSLALLERLLTSAKRSGSATSATTASVRTATAAGAAGVPACASESGSNYSTGPSNTNPSSGATGRYQILPSTAAAYGCSLATPAGQDACAQTIYSHQGAGAWVGCGG
jgi:hypothetical protein